MRYREEYEPNLDVKRMLDSIRYEKSKYNDRSYGIRSSYPAYRLGDKVYRRRDNGRYGPSDSLDVTYSEHHLISIGATLYY